jgi:hypothetical protein
MEQGPRWLAESLQRGGIRCPCMLMSLLCAVQSLCLPPCRLRRRAVPAGLLHSFRKAHSGLQAQRRVTMRFDHAGMSVGPVYPKAHGGRLPLHLPGRQQVQQAGSAVRSG